MDTNLNSLIAIGIIVMLMLAIALVLFVVLYQRRIISHQLDLKAVAKRNQRALTQASVQSTEDERKRIAEELHDDVGATLSSIRLFLHRPKNGTMSDEILLQSKALLDESIAKIRAISYHLQPEVLQHLGLQLALQSTLDSPSQSGQMHCTFSAQGNLPQLSGPRELAAYRICQELVTNIVRHSNATQLHIEVRTLGNEIRIEVTHDGIGLLQKEYEALVCQRGSTGLKNITNREASAHASIRFYKGMNGLFTTELCIPVTLTEETL